MKLEVAEVPASDADRAESFYETLGWRLDIEHVACEDFRVVQLTLPGLRAAWEAADRSRHRPYQETDRSRSAPGRPLGAKSSTHGRPSTSAA
ncbi:MAG TPA: hypothetical protein VN327_02380 [Pseudonocardiaceae bacterium]|jgi:catechol 2,3-dioxygenase-like lactoylglutathione lyase family enzyme|nr:hypothetical protein [Pseudonocardiaceae bacterium]